MKSRIHRILFSPTLDEFVQVGMFVFVSPHKFWFIPDALITASTVTTKGPYTCDCTFEGLLNKTHYVVLTYI